jgi:hypothetical protein
VTNLQIEQRLAVLEKAVGELKAHARSNSNGRRWWVEDAARFANDPAFDEIVRLGQKYRQSLRPRRSG